jgi:hypothetical protein
MIPAESFFKILRILHLTAQYIYSITMFIVNNRGYFAENSELHDITTRKNKNFFQTQSNLSIHQQDSHYGGIKI